MYVNKNNMFTDTVTYYTFGILVSKFANKHILIMF